MSYLEQQDLYYQSVEIFGNYLFLAFLAIIGVCLFRSLLKNKKVFKFLMLVIFTLPLLVAGTLDLLRGHH